MHPRAKHINARTNPRRRALLGAVGTAGLIFVMPALGQQLAGKVWRIGYLAARSRSTPANPDPFYDAFARALRELGYVEGKNLVIEWRFADGDYTRLDALARELIALKVDVIATHATEPTRAAQRATSTIPIVTAAIGDPVVNGFSGSLAHPTGNITGLTNLSEELSGKRLELIRIFVPKVSRVAILLNGANAGSAPALDSARVAARTIGVTLLPIDVRDNESIERGFARMVQEKAGAVMVVNDAFFHGRRRQLADMAAKYRVPAIYPYREYVTDGGLMNYGQNLSDVYRRSASYVDKILKGAKPGDLPIEQPMRIHMAVNRKTATALGLKIPPELVLRADEVIE